MATLSETLRRLELLTGRGRATSLLKLCHAGRLVGGLSVSLRALPDEAIGGLTHAMGGAATRLKVLDARGERPMELEVQAGDVHEKWEVDGVEGLVHNLNDVYRSDAGVKQLAVLGDWEDMLQLWALSHDALRALLDSRWLDARNQASLVRAVEHDSSDDA